MRLRYRCGAHPRNSRQTGPMNSCQTGRGNSRQTGHLSLWEHGRMTWTAPEVKRVGGSLVAPEAEMLRGLLDWHRSTLLFKCAGLTGEQLAQATIEQSNLSLLGVIRHLAKVERIRFRRR